nr:PI-actitoxin-Afv2a [Drosophila bipectinata]
MKIIFCLILFLVSLHLSEQIKNVCLQPLDKGNGKAYIRRWFYNSTSQKCQRFIFLGGAQNGNNFETKAQCKTACL